MLRMMAILFGIGFIFAGVAGFLPSFMPNGLLLGFFAVDSVHNMVHIASGVVAIMCAMSYRAAKFYFIIFGLIYGAIGILGFACADSMNGMQMNIADNILHVSIAAVALFLGFSAREF